MLQTDDVGNLFACLQAAYGHTWAHKADAVPVWQAALKNFSAEQVMTAANVVVERYKDFPPTLPQFVEIVQGRKERVTTYLPPRSFRPSEPRQSHAEDEAIKRHARLQTDRQVFVNNFIASILKYFIGCEHDD